MDRRWVYAGLGVVAGVGLLRVLWPSRPRVTPGETRLLLVGDSLAVGLGPPLRALARDQSVSFEQLAKEGTRIDQWAGSQKLTERLAAFRPTLVLVSLGTNDEYMMGDGGARQAPHLDQLLSKLQAAGAEVAWIGPPTLPKAGSNGVLALLRARIPGSHYYHSEQLTIPRAPDRLHPTLKGYAGWAGMLWQWLS